VEDTILLATVAAASRQKRVNKNDINQNDGTSAGIIMQNNGTIVGENDLNRCDLLDPVILQILEDVKGKTILDAGCGDGYLSRKLARLGASVTGVDAHRNYLILQ